VRAVASADLVLPPDLGFAAVSQEALGVFGPNRQAAFHRWVTFTEGFSAQLVLAELRQAESGTRVFDPFGGTGTAPLVAAQLGLEASYAEVNPYLAESAATKIAAARAPADHRAAALLELQAGVDAGPTGAAREDHPLLVANGARDFLRPDVARELVGWLARFERLEDELARRLGRLAVAASAVPVSNMKRAVDLRRRTAAELARLRPSPADEIRRRLAMFAEDFERTPEAAGDAECISSDARRLPESFGGVDLVVTSPPYLNGTNYFRNTKLELLLLELIGSESDLGPLRTRAITAGINNVSKRIADPVEIEAVETVAERLDEAAYDDRIPKMVRAYFADMRQVLLELRRVVVPGGRLVLDIGDSRFAGVHVDTPELLGDIAETAGWERMATEVIRSRVAKDGGALCQKLLYLSSS
jgi:DNA modification methylase